MNPPGVLSQGKYHYLEFHTTEWKNYRSRDLELEQYRFHEFQNVELKSFHWDGLSLGKVLYSLILVLSSGNSRLSFALRLVIAPVRQSSKRQSARSMAGLTSETPLPPPCPTPPKPHGARHTVSSPHGLCPAAPLAAMRRAYSTPGVSPPIVCRHLLSTDTCTQADAGSPCERASTG
jgi:hypothetical protein